MLVYVIKNPISWENRSCEGGATFINTNDFTRIVLFDCEIIINDQYMLVMNIHVIRKYHILNYCNGLNFKDSFDSFSVKKYRGNRSLNYSVIIFHISWFWKSKGTSWTVIKLRQATLMANLWVTHIRYSMVLVRDHILE